ncbi:uncharacterized protein HMPREF1541_07255 [Cyphellophora europaea CBS 101466]|uniref:ATPase AAA-type core domain-containing protein n=1 Tax=Cyphellophora europaea (strain CBS 101466) TaxID=1220924 RepID=W2RMC0_CYPE1|nr:uncharacterized protein HMPREF1541_07255 [Cyphellophora europaea CBS 101466]ETN37632.1 hypothetical protein HMPREF1541_07255 [Cyphellophora europaea CBS 101466]
MAANQPRSTVSGEQPRPPSPTSTFYAHTSAPRVNTDATLHASIRAAHPTSTITIIPEFNSPFKLYAQATSNATITPLSPDSTLSWLLYFPPPRRLDGGAGVLATETFYEVYLLHYKSAEFLVYFADGRDGTSPYPQIRNQYVVSTASDAAGPLTTLVREAGQWLSALNEEIWVFDQGYWQKDAELYHNIMQSTWDNVILHEELKDDLISTVSRFFDSRDDYDRLGVPWKRGLIFYGPPGNGKTVSIKATMHTLYKRRAAVPSLYVKSLQSFAGPEYSISAIFGRARAEAPCYLVFEDLDSMVTDDVRSFFLNAVDGLAINEGVLMVGSTNHLERLDPGIAKRPSRFDRKYLFDDPDKELRTRYAEFWRKKVRDAGEGKGTEGVHDRKEKEGEVEFPKVLCEKIAGITDGFSFAYMQEAFVSALLVIATRQREGTDSRGDEVKMLGEQWELLDLEENEKASDGGNGDDGDDKDLDKYVLWREIKKQVETLRKEMDKKKGD